MEKWFLSKDSSCVTLFVNDTIYGEVESIQPVKTETGMMKATFINPDTEAIKLKLKSFDRTANQFCDEFTQRELLSRTAFLEKYEDVFVNGTDDSSGSMTDTAMDVDFSTDLDITETEFSASSGTKTSASSGVKTSASSGVKTSASSGVKTSASSGVKTSASSGAKTSASSGAKTSAPSSVRTVYTSDQKLLGEGIDVHLDNLVEPQRRRRVRGLDLQHVLFLEKSFMSSPGQLHLLVGNVMEDITDVDTLKESGTYEVEVLGGNHTRAAIQNLRSKGLWATSTVKMNVYRRLTTIEALQQGQLHNDVLNKSKKPTFMDNCRLIRSLKPAGQSPDDIRSWKEDLMTVYSYTTLKEVSNNMKNYLTLCRAPEDVFQKILKVDQLWTEGLIKTSGKPGPIQQTFFIAFFRILEEDIQTELLDVLMEEGQKVFEDRVRKLQPQRQKKTTEMSDESEMSNERRQMNELEEKIAELERTNTRLVLENSILKKKNEALMSSHRPVAAIEEENHKRPDTTKGKGTSVNSTAHISNGKGKEQQAKKVVQSKTTECPPKEKEGPVGKKRPVEHDNISNPREKRKKLEETTYEVGEKVEAYWKDVKKQLCKWYKDTEILKKEGNDKYYVEYQDGARLSIPSKWIRRV